MFVKGALKIAWSFNNNVSNSGGRSPPDPLPGLCPSTPLKDFRSLDPLLSIVLVCSRIFYFQALGQLYRVFFWYSIIQQILLLKLYLALWTTANTNCVVVFVFIHLFHLIWVHSGRNFRHYWYIAPAYTFVWTWIGLSTWISLSPGLLPPLVPEHKLHNLWR